MKLLRSTIFLFIIILFEYSSSVAQVKSVTTQTITFSVNRKKVSTMYAYFDSYQATPDTSETNLIPSQLITHTDKITVSFSVPMTSNHERLTDSQRTLARELVSKIGMDITSEDYSILQTTRQSGKEKRKLTGQTMLTMTE